jgi:hypothetical protein
MKSRRIFGPSLLVAAALMFVPVSTSATNLRGAVTMKRTNGRTYPLRRGMVELCRASNGKLRTVVTAYTNASGIYFLRNVSPGTYYVKVKGKIYKVTVKDRASQDLPRIVIK